MKEISGFLEAVSKTLQEARSETGVSQRELAKRMECAKSFIASMEGGHNQPSLATLFVLANELAIQPEELVKRIKVKLLMLDPTPKSRPQKLKTK